MIGQNQAGGNSLRAPEMKKSIRSETSSAARQQDPNGGGAGGKRKGNPLLARGTPLPNANGSYAHGSQEYGTSRSPPVNPQRCPPWCFSTRFKYSHGHSGIASKFFCIHTRSRPVLTTLSPVIPRNVMARHCAFKCRIMPCYVTSRHVMSWVQPSPVQSSHDTSSEVKPHGPVS